MSPTRRRKKPQYKPFRLRTKIKPPISKDLPSVRKLIFDTCLHMWRYRKVFVGVILIYIVLNLVLVKSLSSALDIPALKQELKESSVASGATLNAVLLGVVVSSGSNGSTEVSSLYQTIITVVFMLSFIWLFRETHEHKLKRIQLKIKQPFYEGMTPIIPFILTLILIGLQLLPMMIGVGVFSSVQINGLAVTGIETFLWALLAILLSILTFYLVSASMFGLIIVTLPGETPISAYKSAKKVVAFRRWVIMRKLLLYLLVVGLIYAGVMFASIIIFPVATEWILLILSSIILPLSIGCVYKLYRALL
ncbi:hypothetical protein KC947_02780 [Candidatus Saccharibacteria bacterium]|nr:hypothetical protein [Candidatus Saccharibacteria bacterium]